MTWRFIAVGLAILGTFSILPAAGPPEELLTSPGLLLGDWESTVGMRVHASLLANKTVVLTGGKLADGQEAGVRLGSYKAVGRGVWSATVRDDKDRAYNFSIVFNRSDVLTVVDGKGNQATLQRARHNFDKLDKNKDGVITEDEIDDPVMARRFYDFTLYGVRQLDRRQFAQFIEKYGRQRTDK